MNNSREAGGNGRVYENENRLTDMSVQLPAG